MGTSPTLSARAKRGLRAFGDRVIRGGVEHPRIVELVRVAVASARAPEPPLGERHGSIPVSHYTSPERLAREKALLFDALPIPLAHVDEVARPGDCLVRDLVGVSLLVVRGADGVLRAFKNACRHRGTRLVREDCREKAFVCPYHGWTYGLDGALRHVPHKAAFPDLDVASQGLAEVRVEERHGLVWIALDPAAPSVAAHLGPLEDELGALSLSTHVAHRRVVREQRGNWKMLVEAFLEGYHIRTLHRDTIYPFFLDSRSHAERAGLHVRHASARRAALEVDETTLLTRPLRELATYAYVLFPCTTIIVHPDWTSHVVVHPLGTDRFVWQHTMLLSDAPATDAARAHFDRSFSLIEDNVFTREDLFAVAEMQAGIETGALGAMTFGRLESPALWLHDGIRDVLGE
jgi:phenylpropionate dioxygenase-like ring-hydroxylating dioxygenase large terminal subunit